MRVAVNGEPREVASGITVLGLLELLGLGAAPVAVERNRIIVPRASHGETVVSEGDELEIVQFVGGG